MSHETLSAVKAPMALDLCQECPLEPEAASLVQADLTPQQFLDLLIEHAYFQDATRFLAHALPTRVAVWWACRCVRAVLGDRASPQDVAALQAAETWVHEPSEENRRASMPAAEATGLCTPAGWAAVAAFWSGGSLAPADVPIVPPGACLSAHAVSGAVMLAAVWGEPAHAPDMYAAFFAQGKALMAAHEDPWSTSCAAPHLPPPCAADATAAVTT